MFEMDIENETHLPLEQICKIVDCPHSTPQYSDEPTGYYCVRSQDLTDEGQLVFENMRQVSRDTFENRISRHAPKAEDIFNDSEIIVKVKEPLTNEIKMIKEKLKDSKTSDDEAIQLRLKLQKIPLNALSVRKRNRCALTGRPRGVYRKFTLGRTKLREMAMSGLIPGLTKASW